MLRRVLTKPLRVARSLGRRVRERLSTDGERARPGDRAPASPYAFETAEAEEVPPAGDDGPPESDQPDTRDPLGGFDVRHARTPNPHTMRFDCSVDVVRSGSVTFSHQRPHAEHPLSRPLLAIVGVRVVFATGDYVTITKRTSSSWNDIVPQVEDVLETVLTTRESTDA